MRQVKEIQANKKKAEDCAVLVKVHRSHAVELEETKFKNAQLEKELKSLKMQGKAYMEKVHSELSKVKAQFHEQSRLRAELEEKLEQEQAAKKAQRRAELEVEKIEQVEVSSEVEKMEEVVGVAAQPR